MVIDSEKRKIIAWIIDKYANTTYGIIKLCKHKGIAPTTLYVWLDLFPELNEAFQQAKIQKKENTGEQIRAETLNYYRKSISGQLSPVETKVMEYRFIYNEETGENERIPTKETITLTTPTPNLYAVGQIIKDSLGITGNKATEEPTGEQSSAPNVKFVVDSDAE